MYSVLKFPETEDPPEIVPTFWVDELKMKTKWPPYDQPEKILKAIRKCVMPEDDWPEYTYMLFVCKCDDYEEASKKRRDADLYSDIENTEKLKQTRKARHKKIFSSDYSGRSDSSDESSSSPIEIIKTHSQCTTPQSQKNDSTNVHDTFKKRTKNVCVDANANDSHSPPSEIVKIHSQDTMSQSHKNDSTNIHDTFKKQTKNVCVNANVNDSYSPPPEIIKPHSQGTKSQSRKNDSTNICDTFKKRSMNMCTDVNANDSYNPPQKVLKTHSRCSTYHKNDSTKKVDSEQNINLEQFCNSDSESEFEENESSFENVDNNIKLANKENNNVKPIASKTRISTSKANIMSSSGECKEINNKIAKNGNDNSQSHTQEGPFDVEKFGSAVLKLIRTKQNKIVRQNRIIMDKIMTLEKKILQDTTNCQLSDETKDTLRKTFVIKTVNDLEEFDASLKKKKFFDEVVEFLKQKGGPDVRSHVFNILNSTISNIVATQYSYKGQKKKKRFLDLMFNTCIYKAAQMHTPSATDDNVRTAIAAWLDNSSSRLKNEHNKRAKEPNLRRTFEDNSDEN
ncbi:uncharacterized protein [Temnothorax nylanderi]|uniref:uncharacterized protein n=1 Tax=Temnothorax nylanderi TaxID=102681 RepID=UPI003A84996C